MNWVCLVEIEIEREPRKIGQKTPTDPQINPEIRGKKVNQIKKMNSIKIEEKRVRKKTQKPSLFFSVEGYKRLNLELSLKKDEFGILIILIRLSSVMFFFNLLWDLRSWKRVKKQASCRFCMDPISTQLVRN